jgi:hypothetical protein
MDIILAVFERRLKEEEEEEEEDIVVFINISAHNTPSEKSLAKCFFGFDCRFNRSIQT